jgi:hypothetical protein
VPNAALRGVHLQLPGHGDDGPTLEIYTFASTDGTSEVGIDRPGFRHIAFAVADVHTARRRVLDEGGNSVVTDPAGNAVELQSWAPPA